jgi:hypothetical protein
MALIEERLGQGPPAVPMNAQSDTHLTTRRRLEELATEYLK